MTTIIIYVLIKMPFSVFDRLKSQKGISIITIIILAAVVFAGMNAYAYFNPDFQFRKYSIVYLLGNYYDDIRKSDLAEIQIAVEKYKDENGEYPTFDGWCGRIISVLHPDAKDAISPYFGEGGIPEDPSHRGTGQDYFYRREDRNNYVLLTTLDNLPTDSPTFNYDGCFDWPGDGIYNYQISNAD